MTSLRFLDLFSGIGGFSLGLERAGHRTVAFCEIDPFCKRVLRKHWPHIPCYGDISALSATRLAADGISNIDAVCGGFPCQDISLAGKGAGIDGERSGLWQEYRRLVGELRPRYVLVENVAALLGRGLSTVLGDLAALGYDCEWHCIPASAIGAPHLRDRIWIVANASEQGPQRRLGQQNKHGAPQLVCWQLLGSSDWWSVEPDVDRVVNGVPDRVHRIKALGNAIVPQIAEIIGRAI